MVLRISEHTLRHLSEKGRVSAARAVGFNRVAVSNIFGLLTSVLDDHRLTPDRIYNVDESNITVNP